ncbi:MAG TPA: RNA polymerase sigma factor [Acidobacteriota bacterium]
MTRQNLLLLRTNKEEINLDEREAIRLCLQGDSHAFEGIVEKYRNQVFWNAYYLVFDYEDARDVAQQTFLKVWKSLASYDMTKSFSAWISRIATRCAIDFLRRRKEQEQLPEMTFVDPLERNLDIRKIFLRIAPVLPERQRTVLVLREVYQFEVIEIAELLKCTESTVRNHLSQAKTSFRTKIKELFPEYGM